ncbi:hypothetical protein Tco_0378917 [Tanacetum coccineum]
MAFPRLQELVAAQNSNNLIDAMSVYIQRQINDDIQFAAGLSHLWEVLYSRVNEHRLLIAELNVFGGPLALQCADQITKVDPPVGLFINHITSLFECDFVSFDPRLQSKKSAMDSSFTLGSTEEADNFKILQSCNGLLLCSGSGRRVFDYVYNPSNNQYKKLPYLDFSLDNSPYYSSAGLRMAFDPTKLPHYKLVDARRTSCDIDI